MVKITLIKTQRALAATQISIAPFVINPYRGCTSGCFYCYAKNNKVFKQRKDTWGTFLDVKENIVNLLEKELATTKPRRVLIGSVCEPFVAEETTYKLTENILRNLNQKGIPYTILSRSPIIERYLDLIAQNVENKIYFTVNFLEKETKMIFEPFINYDPADLKNLFRLFNHKNIKFRVQISPFIPFIINIENILNHFLPFTEEIFIEGYNPWLGSWEIIKNIIQNKFPNHSKEISNIYEREREYLIFTKQFQNTLNLLEKKYNKQILSFIPAFASFYNDKIFYEPFPISQMNL